MRKNFGAKPLLQPQPVFMLGTYNDDGSANAMAAAWGGHAEEDEIFICISADHKTTENILKRKAFTVSMATESTAVQCDYLGLVSGKDDPKKVERVGFHPSRSELVDAPLFDELPMAFECELLSFERESCRLFGKVRNVSVDVSVLNESGKIDLSLLRPICFDACTMGYNVVGERIANAFHDGGKYIVK